MSWFNDFIGRFSQETKPRAQKLANIIDRLTPALQNVVARLQTICTGNEKKKMPRHAHELAYIESNRKIRCCEFFFSLCISAKPSSGTLR